MTRAVRHFLDLPDIPAETLKEILASAHRMKREKFEPPQLFYGMSLAMVFDKKSTRTRMSFEVAMKQLGGHTIVMSADDMHLTGAESIEDTSKVLSRYVDAAMFRISSHETLLEIARHSAIPIINGLTNHSHPCQIMADLVTIEEKLGSVQGKKIAWFGDYNNVARTFAQASKIWDFELVAAVPADLAPAKSDGIKITQDATSAATNADVIVTDTWVSMGQEGKAIEKFLPFQVNPSLMAKAKPGAIFMHCMPIHRGEEVTDSVLATKASVIYDEAENRLHAQKAVLAWCLEGTGVKVL
ncbi:MAG: ornithine carbamoyltransferase [Alphaproteobacteria bacterium]|nr:ornithine carbamoyltransferase [Alphaproteobacteria bacterium]